MADSPKQYDEAANALGLAGALWQALAADDDQTLFRVLVPETFARLGDYQSGAAGRLRDALGLSREACRQMGCVSTVRLLADGSFLVLCVKVRPSLGGIDTYTDELTPVAAWAFVIAQTGDEWRIAGHPDGRPGHRVVGLIDVVPPPSSLVS